LSNLKLVAVTILELLAFNALTVWLTGWLLTEVTTPVRNQLTEVTKCPLWTFRPQDILPVDVFNVSRLFS